MRRIAHFLLFALLALALPAPLPAQEAVLVTLKEKARSLYAAGDLDGALVHANAALRLKVREREMTLLKAEILLKKKEPREAIRLLEPILVREPKNKEALRLLMIARPPKQPEDFEWNRRLAVLHKKYKRQLVSDTVLTAGDYARMADLALKEDLFTKAARMADQAIRLDPRNDARHVHLARILERAGDFESAAQVYDRLDKMKPGSLEVLLCAGELYRKAHKLEFALERFRAAEKLKADDETVIKRILDTSRALGRDDIYSEYLEKKVGTLLTDPKYVRERASAYLRRGEWALALKDLKATAEATKGDGGNYLADLVDLLARGGGPFRYEERETLLSGQVRDDFKEVFRVMSGRSIPALARGKDAKKALARLFHKIGYAPDALRILQTVADEERDPEAHYLMSLVHAQAGEKEMRERSLELAKFANSAFLPARVELAELYLERGGYEQANLELDAVLKIEPNHFRGLLLAARLQRDMGHGVLLEQTIKRLKEIDGGNPDLKAFLDEGAPAAPAPPEPARAPAE